MEKREILALLEEWQSARNTVQDDYIYRSDADHADRMGLPTLASICYLLDEISRVGETSETAEIEYRLRRCMRVAVGEGSERLRIHLDDPSIALPGLAEIPARLLERKEG